MGVEGVPVEETGSAAWRRASRAISFALPHRKEELLEYGDYIESVFAAKVSSSHHKLLLYDIAVKDIVAAELNRSQL